MVGEVRHGTPVLLDAVTDRRPLVRHLRRADRRRPDRDRLLRRVVEDEARRDVGQAHGEQRRRQVHRDPIRERLHRRRRSPEVHLEIGSEQRTEEPEPLQVVHVQMGQEDVQHREAVVGVHRRPERPHARPGVEHERLTAFETHFEARRVAAVANRVGARRGDRAAAAPDARQHQMAPSAGATSQNTDTTPWRSSAAANSGYAVTSRRRRTPS